MTIHPNMFKEFEKTTPEPATTEEAAASGSIQVETELRTIGLFGEVNEERMSEVIGALILLRESGLTVETEQAIGPPIEMILSTPGGDAHDMFAIYDTMRLVREQNPIQTFAIGKVMSAGVLLLAAGTKGHRKIAKNCRAMIHGVTGGHIGTIHNLENEMDEIRWLQERYIDALVAESDMTKRFLKKLIARKVNVYLTAEEAVEYGIADEVV